MKPLNLLVALPLLALTINCNGQPKNARTVTVKIDGDCGMCEKTIESAGLVKGESEVDWDVDSHMARVTYDSVRTDLDAILRRVALAGYDNERYLAPKEAYNKLPGCCQYERSMVHGQHKGAAAVDSQIAANTEHSAMAMEQDSAQVQLKPVFETYFKLKDALVGSDATVGTQAAQELVKALAAVKMEALDHEVHSVWMKVMAPLGDQAEAIAAAKDLQTQRKAFMHLTGPMAQLAKAAPFPTPIYLDHCPMYEGGADWLSTDKAIRNPYYGSMMATCGSVQETIAK